MVGIPYRGLLAQQGPPVGVLSRMHGAGGLLNEAQPVERYQTWPEKLARTIWGGFTLPGDVYAGRVDPNSQEAIERGADLAGALTLGSGALPAAVNEARMGIKAYHGSPKKVVGRLQPSQGGELGPGTYFSKDKDYARGFTADVEGRSVGSVHEFDIDVPIKEITKDEWIGARAKLMDARQRANGGKWEARFAKEAESELIEQYRRQGFGGLYVSDERQGVLFPDTSSLPSVGGAFVGGATNVAPSKSGIRAYHGSPHDLPERTADTMSETIALGSPSGRMSNRAKEAAQKRIAEALFGPGGLKRPTVPQPTEAESLLRQAAELRALAARGMSVRKFTKQADKLEARAREWLAK